MSLASGGIDTLSATRPRPETAMPSIVRAGSIDAAATTVGDCGVFRRWQPAAAIGGGLAPLVAGLDGALGGGGGVPLPLISLALIALVATLAPKARGAARDP